MREMARFESSFLLPLIFLLCDLGMFVERVKLSRNTTRFFLLITHRWGPRIYCLYRKYDGTVSSEEFFVAVVAFRGRN